MASFYETGSELLRKGREMLENGRDIAIRKSEKILKIERLKMDIRTLKRDKDENMSELGRKIYELYSQNKLEDPDLVTICQEVKTIQWQIDEKWTQINNMRAQKD